MASSERDAAGLLSVFSRIDGPTGESFAVAGRCAHPGPVDDGADVYDDAAASRAGRVHPRNDSEPTVPSSRRVTRNRAARELAGPPPRLARRPRQVQRT
ncbi:hypothetical protein DMP23_47115 [Amycolatopsis sp. A1MSW2902]